MKLNKGSVIAGIALLALGVVLGGMLHVSHPPSASAADIASSISLKDGFGPVVKKVMPAIVSVHSTRVVRQTQLEQDDIFGRFFGDSIRRGTPQQAPEQRRQGLGSGVIITEDGYVVTNSHVVEGATEVSVRLSDNREFDAKVIGADPQSDVAVLKIEAKGLPTAPLADSSGVDMGDIVLAMGSPFGLSQTVTMGIVGATGRRNMGIEAFEDFIQTDAAINPGNSGGALVNVNGEVIGINTAIYTAGGGSIFGGGGGGNQGVGFAIPSNMAKGVVDQLISKGKVTRGWLGVSIQQVTPEIAKQFGLSGTPRGALIGDVNAGSPAEKGGLKRGDIVTKLNGVEVKDNLDLRLKVASANPGAVMKMAVYRGGSETEHSVTLGERPADDQLVGSNRGPSARGTPEESAGPKLGVSVGPVTQQFAQEHDLRANTQGVAIMEVAPGSAAGEAGIQVGDVVQEVNRQEVRDAEQFRNLIRNAKGPLLLLVNRGGSTHFVTVQPR